MDPVTDLGVGVATEATKWSLTKIIKHIGYIYKYKENLKSLEDAEEKLNGKRKDASRFAQDTSRKQKDVSSTVADWQPEADELYQNAQESISRNNISCLNLCSRYTISKHALEMAQEINEKVQAAPDFGTAFDRQPHKLGEKLDLTGFMEFESRASVVNQVLEALKDEKLRMCSICGMGGTGKTTLAKKLIQRVEDDHLFGKIAMVTVSQNPNPRKIRGDIVSSLGWTFGSEELETSDKLMDGLMNNDESILLILDDVWEELDFEAIGIPKAKLKILLTSRKEDVCQRMGSEPNFVINVLTEGEAWGLFKGIAMESIEKWKLHDTARKIADECGGLPIVIITLAAALKYEVKATWNDSLLKLRKSNLRGISGLDKVYSQIKLSYDLLNDQEAQSCFLLCCLWPEDYNVPLKYLILSGKGLQLFEHVESMSQARDRVESIIDKLKKSFLLLDGEEDGTVKMHDILRDFAISISSKDKHPYIVGSEKVIKKWPETSQYENCSAISFVCDRFEGHSVDLRCPKLEFLQVRLDDYLVWFPIGNFEGLKELKVVILQVPVLLQSLAMLRKLRSLVICETQRKGENETPKFGDLIGHGDLQNLEIFEWSSNWARFDFPEEIGLLCNLRCLTFSKVEILYMPPGVLSKLVNLEELNLADSFSNWGYLEDRGERVNASLDEIEHLPLLTKLCIQINHHSILAEMLLKNLTSWSVYLGKYGANISYENSNAMLEVVDVNASESDTENWINGLLRRCERYKLKKMRNLKNVICLQSVEDDGFPQWKDIQVKNCKGTVYLVDTIAERIPSSFFSQLQTLKLSKLYDLEEIWPLSKIEAPCFSNLISIEISRCPNLKHVFPLSVARDLRQLQSLCISGLMETIFYRDEVDDGNQVPSSVELTAPTLDPSTSIDSTLTILNPSTSTNSKFICPTPNSCIRGLLGREKQKKMEENIAKVEEKEVDHPIMDAIIFPKLKTLELEYLQELRVFYDGNHAIELPSLEELRMHRCYEIEALSYGSFNAPKLEKIRISDTYYPTQGKDLNAFVKKMLNKRWR